MSTLEAVRDLIYQAAEAPPGDVLRAAQDEVVRLSDLMENAKNVLQRNGARKKLAELQPLMPALEIEVGLSQLEKLLAEGKSSSQRAAARVQSQKLSAQITALPTSEEKEYFQQWLADLHPPAASTSSPGGSQSEPSPAPPVAAESPPPSLPDPAVAIQAAVVSLDTLAKTRPITDPVRLAEETEALARRIAALAPGEPRSKLESGINSITTALKLDEELRLLGQAIDGLAQKTTQPEPNLPALQAEHGQLVARLGRVNGAQESEGLKKKLGEIETWFTARREGAEIEVALQRCAARVKKDPTDDMIETRLAALTDRVVQLPNAELRTALSQKIELLRKTVAQRQEEVSLSEALEEIRRRAEDAEAPLPDLRSNLNELAKRVQGLPTGQIQSDLEQRVRESRQALASIPDQSPALPPQPAVVLTLEPIKGRSAPTARPLVFVARDRFSIGRKPENEPPRADLLTPSSELRVSRVHVTLLARQRQIQILAGEEGKPSMNPALLDETPLSGTPLAASFETERRIDLTGVFTLRAKLLPSATPYGPPFSEEENSIQNNTTVLVPPISGALRIRPQGEDRLPITAVWLFTDASIGTHPNCAVTLIHPGMAAEQVRIHFWRKSFWIELIKPGTPVQLAGKSLTPGATQPLATGQELRLGNFVYKVQLS